LRFPHKESHAGIVDTLASSRSWVRHCVDQGDVKVDVS
jgi:hypothetical protein